VRSHEPRFLSQRVAGVERALGPIDVLAANDGYVTNHVISVDGGMPPG
jgi:hypothetical protein